MHPLWVGQSTKRVECVRCFGSLRVRVPHTLPTVSQFEDPWVREKSGISVFRILSYTLLISTVAFVAIYPFVPSSAPPESQTTWVKPERKTYIEYHNEVLRREQEKYQTMENIKRERAELEFKRQQNITYPNSGIR